MGIIAVAVEHMIAAGVTGDALVRAIADMEAQQATAAIPAALEKRRAYDRERKREKKAREKMSGGIPTESNGIPAEDAESAETGALPLPPNEINSNPPAPTHPEGSSRAREADPFPKPEWADPQLWRDLKANRKAKRLPNTATAYAKLLKDIAKLTNDEWPPGRLLEHAVARGWGAIYEPDEMKAAKNGNGSQTNLRNAPGGYAERDTRDGFQRHLDERIFRSGSDGSGKPAQAAERRPDGEAGRNRELPLADR